MRLIDADALKKEVDNFQNCYNGWSDTYDKAYIIEAIEEAPTIKPKRGEWKIEKTESVWGKGYMLTCSECGDTFRVTENALSHEHFCRNCGADMRKEK